MDQRPHILLILTDQHRANALALGRHAWLRTPCLDRLAAQGVHFETCHSSCTAESAARRSLFGGQFPTTHGLVGHSPQVFWTDLPETLPEALKKSGYQTCLAGRWHCQHPPTRPLGFQCMARQGPAGTSDYDYWLAENAPEPDAAWLGTGLHELSMDSRPWHLPEGLHPVNWSVRQALNFLESRDPKAPFFLTLSLHAPRPPLLPPACYLERYERDAIPPPVMSDWAEQMRTAGEPLTRPDDPNLKTARAGYFAALNHLDNQLGRLLAEGTEAHPLPENTIILYTSTSGEMLGDHGQWQTPLPYEAATAVPLIIAAPEAYGFRQGSTVRKPTCLEDVMPTLLDLAGIPAPDTVEGRSLLRLCRGESEPDWREFHHIEHAPLYHAMTDGEEKFVWFAHNGAEQFFDLREDPREQTDLIDSPLHQERIAVWRHHLMEELTGRPERFTDGRVLISGRSYHALLPHGGELQ